jgi:repressor LexA
VEKEVARMYLTKRQKEMFDFITDYIRSNGYAPSIDEIRQHFHLASLATVHKHLKFLERKGAITRQPHQSRSIELLPTSELNLGRVAEVPLLGMIAAGQPIEAIEVPETLSIPEEMLGRGKTYVLKVRGDSMIEEQIRDGDFVIIEERAYAEEGETVVALLHGEEVTLKKFYREGTKVKLQPANPALEPIIADAEEVRIQGIVIGLLRKY